MSDEWSAEAEFLHVAHIRSLLHKIYTRHAPEKLEYLGALMDQWSGEEESLLLQVREKYGVAESPRESDGTQEDDEDEGEQKARVGNNSMFHD